jgi:hypothetical protein
MACSYPLSALASDLAGPAAVLRAIRTQVAEGYAASDTAEGIHCGGGGGARIVDLVVPLALDGRADAARAARCVVHAVVGVLFKEAAAAPVAGECGDVFFITVRGASSPVLGGGCACGLTSHCLRRPPAASVRVSSRLDADGDARGRADPAAPIGARVTFHVEPGLVPTALISPQLADALAYAETDAHIVRQSLRALPPPLQARPRRNRNREGGGGGGSRADRRRRQKRRPAGRGRARCRV